MSEPDGGPAFPRPLSLNPKYDDWTEDAQEGMTLRDWFAGKVLPELLRHNENRTDTVAEAYLIADEMLKRRRS